MVPGLFQLSHVEKAIFTWNILIGVPNIDDYIEKPLAIHDMMESKWGTFVHGDICGIPPFTNICNYKPTSHVELKTIPLGEPLKHHWDI